MIQTPENTSSKLRLSLIYKIYFKKIISKYMWTFQITYSNTIYLIYQN